MSTHLSEQHTTPEKKLKPNIYFRLNSNTYNEMKSEGGDDTGSQTNITAQLSTSSSTLVIASPLSVVNSTNNSNSSNKTHLDSLANSQSTSSYSLHQTNSSHRITRSLLLTKYLYSTTNINNNKESYDDDGDDMNDDAVLMRRRRRRSKSSHGRRIVHRHEITNSEIPVHEFEERFEGPPKPPHKVLPTSSSSKHDNNLNFIKGVYICR